MLLNFENNGQGLFVSTDPTHIESNKGVDNICLSGAVFHELFHIEYGEFDQLKRVEFRIYNTALTIPMSSEIWFTQGGMIKWLGQELGPGEYLSAACAAFFARQFQSRCTYQCTLNYEVAYDVIPF